MSGTVGDMVYPTLKNAAMAGYYRERPHFTDGVLAERSCRTCGSTFRPRSRTQLYCPPCGNERKRNHNR